MPKRMPKHRDARDNIAPLVLEIVLSTSKQIEHDKLIQAIVASVTSEVGNLITVERNILRKAIGSHLTSTTIEVVLVSPDP